MERFFKLSKFDTTMKTEILAGLTTFITMAYIIFVNPSILANAQGVTPDMIMALTIGTCLSAAFGSLMMGFYANLPFALAPGMGLNAFFAFTVATTLGYNGALGAIFISGILFMIITFLGWREAIVEAIPDNMKAAVEAGVGLFIAFIGLQNAGIVVADPDTFVAVGDFSTFAGAAPAIVSISGLLMLGILSKFKVKMALLLSIIFSTLLAFPLGLIEIPQFMNWSDLDLSRTFFQMDFKPLFALGSGSFWSSVLSILTIIIAFTLSDMFNALGTFISMEKYIDMPDKDGNRRSMTKAMMTDAAATTAGACFGCSTITTYIESGAGIAQGGRTGLTAVTVGILFLVAMIVAPVAGMIPSAATAPALIFVGIQMLGSISKIKTDDLYESLPAFFTLLLMPFTYNIAIGIAGGIILYVFLKLFAGRAKEVNWIMWILAALFILQFAVSPT